MRNRQSSIDGFVKRRSGNRISSSHDFKRNHGGGSVEAKLLHNTGSDKVKNLDQHKVQTGRALGRSDIEDSLKGINVSGGPEKKLSRRQRRKLANNNKKPRSLKRRITKWFIIILVVALLSAGSFVVYKIVRASKNSFKGDFLGLLVSNKPLKQDSNGRSNFLLLGTSEDDQGHDGADLTDSMMIISVDQKNKNIYMFSIPRDLYVKYGEACPAGYAGKINAYFSCSNDGTTAEAEQDRLAKTQSFVGDIFGMDIQYGVHVNHTVIKQAVDAVGGVDVDVQGSNGDSGVLDRNFDWRCNYKCYLVKYDNGVHHLDGEHALFLSMARGDIAPTYGLGNSNFDREKNQQKIIMALKTKATSTGILTNLGAITKLIDALGDNLRTNIGTDEIKTLVQVASDTKQTDIHTLSLFGDENAVVTTGNYGGASVVMPAAGIFDYSDIKLFVSKNLTSNSVTREAAPIVVLNGTGETGYGQTKADGLTSEGYSVTLVDNAPDGTYGKVEIYQIGTENNIATAAKLAEKYKIKVKTTAPPIEVTSDVKFVIIYGATDN